jgi:hypothetical protein
MSGCHRTPGETLQRVAPTSFAGKNSLPFSHEFAAPPAPVLAVAAAVEQNSTENTDMKRSCKFLLLIFAVVGLAISCSEPPNPRMAELQRYYALKGDGINPPVKSVALKTTGQAGTMADSRTAPVLSTTNVPLSTTNNVPALSTTNVPALSTPNPSALYSTNAPATLAPSTNAPAVP